MQLRIIYKMEMNGMELWSQDVVDSYKLLRRRAKFTMCGISWSCDE